MIRVLSGENDYFIHQEMVRLSTQFAGQFGESSVERWDGESLELARLRELLLAPTLFSSERMVIITNLSASKSLFEELLALLAKLPDDLSLVLIEPSFDRKSKAFKVLAEVASIKYFSAASSLELKKWLHQLVLEQGGKIDPGSIDYLINMAGSDQWRLEQEVQKLINYTEEINQEAIDALVEPSPTVNAFQLLDDVLLGRSQGFTAKFEAFMRLEDPYRFMGLLVSQIYTLALVKSAGSRQVEDIARESNVYPGFVRKAKAAARRLEVEKLTAIVEAVAFCDMQSKTTGIEPWLLIGQALGKIMAYTSEQD